MCYTREDLRHYVAGEMSEPEAALVEVHLDLCRPCGETAEEYLNAPPEVEDRAAEIAIS